MEEREALRIAPDDEVFDVDGHKVGSVVHVYEGVAAAGAPAPAVAVPPIAGEGPPPLAGAGVFEVKTGLFGLGKHYYIPVSAVKDITEGGIFVRQEKAALDTMGWETKPDLAAYGDAAGPAVAPARSTEVVQPSTAGEAGTSEMEWDTAARQFRTRWSERYGAQGAQWATYEPRYRFAWEMAHRPEYQGHSWITVQPALRSQWEVLHPDQEWDTVADTIRDAWEHLPALVTGHAHPRRDRSQSLRNQLLRNARHRRRFQHRCPS